MNLMLIFTNFYQFFILKITQNLFQQHMGSREGVASKIDADAQVKLQEMLRALANSKEPVIQDVLEYVYDIVVELHKNYREDI